MYSEYVNVLIIGKSGSGKSKTGNILLGYDYFEVKSSINSITDKVSYKEIPLRTKLKSKLYNKYTHLRVIDTPGIFDTNYSNEKIISLISNVAQIAPEGIHAVILMLDGNIRFNLQELETVDVISKYFDQGLFHYTILSWKHRMPSDEEVNENQYLNPLVAQCAFRQVEVNLASEDNLMESKILLEHEIADLVNRQTQPLSGDEFRRVNSRIWYYKLKRMSGLVLEPLGVLGMGVGVYYNYLYSSLIAYTVYKTVDVFTGQKEDKYRMKD